MKYENDVPVPPAPEQQAMNKQLYDELHKRAVRQALKLHDSGIKTEESRKLPGVTGGWTILFFAWERRLITDAVAQKSLQNVTMTVDEADAIIELCDNKQ